MSVVVVLPGVVPLLLFLVFTYLHEQSRQPYFRAWQLAWAAYTLHFGLDSWSRALGTNTLLDLIASVLLVAMALCILVSTRLTRRLTTSERMEAFRPLFDMARRGLLKTKVEKAYPLSEVKAAVAHAAQGKRSGKIMLEFE